MPQNTTMDSAWYRVGYLEGVLFDLAHGLNPLTAGQWSESYRRQFPDRNGVARLLEIQGQDPWQPIDNTP